MEPIYIIGRKRILISDEIKREMGEEIEKRN
jgi:hypothetical protein